MLTLLGEKKRKENKMADIISYITSKFGGVKKKKADYTPPYEEKRNKTASAPSTLGGAQRMYRGNASDTLDAWEKASGK